MKKYVFEGLIIEVTRRCNKQCAHCLRGEAQNVTISKEIVDKLFDEVGDCLKAYLAGGEVLLEPEMLKYILGKMANNWNTIQVEITTNGSVLDGSIVEALEKFCQNPMKKLDMPRRVQLTISKDEYHSTGEWQKAINFYQPLFDEANQRLGGTKPKLMLKTWSPVDKDEVSKQGDLQKPTLIYAGRGVNLLDKAIKEGWVVRVPFINNHRLKIEGNFIRCTTMVTARGDVVVAAEDDSYDAYDQNAVGNIMTKSLDDIIDDHQNNCVLSCNETNYINRKNMTDLLYSYMGKSELSTWNCFKTNFYLKSIPIH